MPNAHPSWSIRRLIPTPLGPITRPVLFLGTELTLHGPTAEHVIANARKLGVCGEIEAVRP